MVLSLAQQLIIQDIKARYRGTVLGVMWLFLQPLALLLVYAFIFGEIFQLRSPQLVNNHSFIQSLFLGLIVFNALTEVIQRAPNLFIERRDLLLNTSLPVQLLPWIPVVTSLVLEAISLGIFSLWMLWQGKWLAWNILLLLPWILMRLLWSLALAELLSSLGVFWRDLHHIVPPFLSVLLLLSPILYPLSAVPTAWQSAFMLNPVTTLVQGYQQALLLGIFDVGRYVQTLVFSGLFFLLCQQWARQLSLRIRYVL